MAPPDRVCLGVITAPHGVKGLVRVKSFTAAPEGIAHYAPLEDETGRKLPIAFVGAAKGVLLARIDGVADRDAAERLRGRRLYLPRAALPPPEEEEYYHADLVGLSAELADGTRLGRVCAVYGFGAGDSLEIERDGAAPILVPFTRAAVPVVDVAGGRVVVAPLEGLLSDGAAEEEGARRMKP
ncbi:MAG TPA: ribosome maturation factor RimM [Stellaceae bacterium]|nr:ribosome maturation factor RimM [Stellaceae bacterium]